ncbi:IS3 family transposase, partial [Dorea sp. BIOML-A1]|nr:IS3 family transposase [Dorea sp. BIOML-A1]
RSSLITAIANYIDYYNNQRLQRKLHGKPQYTGISFTRRRSTFSRHLSVFTQIPGCNLQPEGSRTPDGAPV